MVEGLLLQVSVPETQQLYRLLLSGLPTTNTSHTEHTPYLTQKQPSLQREVKSVRLSCCLANKIQSLIENYNQGLKHIGKRAQQQLPTPINLMGRVSRISQTMYIFDYFATSNMLYCIHSINCILLSQ